MSDNIVRTSNRCSAWTTQEGALYFIRIVRRVKKCISGCYEPVWLHAIEEKCFRMTHD